MATNNSINYQVLDEDNMVSDSNTAVATQQSIKAYIDAQVSTGNFVHVTTQTASAVATIDFTGLDSTYSVYMVYYYGLLPVTDGAMPTLRIGTGGTPTYQTTNYKWANYTADYNSSSAGVGSSSDSKINMIYSGGQGNASTEHISGIILLPNPASSSYQQDIIIDSTRVDAANIYAIDLTAGRYAANTAVTALRFYYSTGNISVGTFKMYGLTGS
jgi:hypothetical protein